jgi:hypothetical protein
VGIHVVSSLNWLTEEFQLIVSIGYHVARVEKDGKADVNNDTLSKISRTYFKWAFLEH